MMSKWPKKLAQASLIPLLATLTACATTTVSDAPVKTFCLIAKPIYWSAADTDATILAVKEHNAVGKSLCGWGTKPAPAS